MPCNCGRRNINQQIQKINKTNKENQIQQSAIHKTAVPAVVQKVAPVVIQKAAPVDVKINSINITSNNLNISYGGAVPPVPPVTSSHTGLLANTAYQAAGSLIADGDSAFRSVGYFGIGFGGNTLGNGPEVIKLSMAEIDMTKFTHVNIAFIAVDAGGNLVLPTSSGGRGAATSSQPPWLASIPTSDVGSQYIFNIFAALQTQRSNSNNKNFSIIPSIGGWNIANDRVYGKNLYDLADSAKINGPMYTTFKNAINTLINTYGADGVDVDWEYPGRDPMVSKCINQSGVVTDCGVSDQTSIICQQGSTPCNGFQVSSASYCGGTWEQPVSEPLNSATPNPQKKANDVQYNAYATFLTQVKLDLKTLTTSKHKPPELSIALAGAAWGLHWYASTVTHLLNTDVIDYANLMAYDFAGYWQTGERSGLLANYTNMDSLDECYGESNCVNKDCYDCLQTGCTSAGHKCGTYGSGAITCGWTGAGYQACSGTKDTPLCSSIPEYDKGCIGAQGVQFSNSNNILTPTSTDQACPLIEYNSLDVNANILATQKVKFNTQWWDDKQVVSNKVAGAGSGILTLSIEAMLNILTDTANGGFGVNPKKLVIGLPYYGRSFQSKTTPVNGTYGLFTKYDYGIPYSFSDIYYKNYKTNSGNVYTVNMKRDNTYTEDIVFAPESGIITKITDDITHEMISYGSVESTKYKVKAAKQDGYGGYMCWHMLSDYYEDMM